MLVKHYRSRRKIYFSDVNLCQMDNHSCIGCCINLQQDYDVLIKFMKMNTELFKDSFPELSSVNPAFLRQYLRELGEKNKRSELYLMYNCYFAGFLDKEEEVVGCLIHPYRLSGIELRDLVPVDCTPRGKCYRDLLWEKLPLEAKKEFLVRVNNSSWFEFSQEIFEFIPYLYTTFLLNLDILEKHYYKLIVKDHGVGVNAKLKRNIELISDFYSRNDLSLFVTFEERRDLFYRYGEMYLEYILTLLAENSSLYLKIIDIPEEILKDGDEYINGEKIYILFAPAEKFTEKTIIIGTNYDNSKDKLSCNDLSKATSLSFLISSIEDFTSGSKKRKVNYLWMFLGGEEDVLYPLSGSYYINNVISEGLQLDSYKVKHNHIIAYINLYNILSTDTLYSINTHIPVSPPGLFLTEYDIFMKEYLYNLLETPFDEELVMGALQDFYIYTSKPEDYPRVNTIIFEDLKRKLLSLIPLSLEKISDAINNILGDLFSLDESEKEKIHRDLYDVFSESIHKSKDKLEYENIKKSFLEKKFFQKSTGKVCRYLVKTHRGFGEKFFSILSKYGFLRAPDKNGKKMSFYYFALSGVPCLSVCGSSDGEGKGDEKAFLKGVGEFVSSLEKEEILESNFIKIID